MEIFEMVIAGIGFVLIGITVGFFTFLIFRISIHQNKFKWSGALSIVTTLCGGGFLSYLTRPLYFGLYAIGYFIGFASYIIYLKYRESLNMEHMSDIPLSKRSKSSLKDWTVSVKKPRNKMKKQSGRRT